MGGPYIFQSGRHRAFLPNIIGADDLVPHTNFDNPERDAWLTQHQDIVREIEERANPSREEGVVEDLFNMPPMKRNNRGRRQKYSDL